MTSLPPDFAATAATLVPETETSDFLAAFDTPAPVSIRYNPIKTPAGERPGTPVPWCATGRYLPERPSFTLDPHLHGGAYYVGEASSMFLEVCFNHIAGQLPDAPRLLDLCAAPGGKSTHLAGLAGPDALLVSNEVIRSRTAVLLENTRKWGLGNSVVTNSDPSRFGTLRRFFDLMLADVPCSGEGMFRKQPSARDEWSPAAVELCAARQQRILADAWETLRPGGFLIYSTCTFNRRENEENVRWIAETLGAEILSPEVPDAWGVTKTDVGGGTAFRFFPHKLQGEGLFMALLRKNGEETTRTAGKKTGGKTLPPLPKKERAALGRWFAEPEQWEFFQRNGSVFGCRAGHGDDLERLASALNPLYFGVEAGQLIHGELKPDHALALCPGLATEAAPRTELTIDEARDYLRKQAINADRFVPGLNLVCFEGTPIGWAKRVAARLNNLYPKEYRIQHL